MKVIFGSYLLLLTFLAGAQPPGGNGPAQRYRAAETTIIYQLGDRKLPIIISRYGNASGIVMINLHDNEVTSVKAAKAWLEEHGGTMIKFQNNNQRTIRFHFRGQRYEFDPNRIFSREGIMASLREQGRITEPAVQEVEKFAERLLMLLPEHYSWLIALHNNTEGMFSVTSYLPGHEREQDARMVTAQPGQDEDDIFLTTDSLLYSQLAEQGFNSIWQHNERVKKDGSLSVYCGQRGIRYLNCETQHGKTSQYLQMISVAGTYMLGGIPGAFTYAYRLTSDSSSLEKGAPLWFGDKQTGMVLSVSGANGKLAIKHNFPLYSNMDLFYFNAEKRLEIRIDPTRESLPLESGSKTLSITVR